MHVAYLYGLTEEPAATQAPAKIQFLRWRREVAVKPERVAKP